MRGPSLGGAGTRVHATRPDKQVKEARWQRIEAQRGRLSLLRPAEEVAMSVLALLRDLAQQHQRDPDEVPVSAFAGAFESILGGSE